MRLLWTGEEKGEVGGGEQMEENKWGNETFMDKERGGEIGGLRANVSENESK